MRRCGRYHHFVNGEDAVGLAEVEYLDFLHPPETGDELISKSHLLCGLESFNTANVCGKLLFHFNDMENGLKEEGSDLGNIVDLLNGGAAAQKLSNGKDVIVLKLNDIGLELFHGHGVELGQVEMAGTDLKGADGLEQTLFDVGADAHDLARGLHLSAEGVRRGGKLVEGETGKLCNNVVKPGLKGGCGVGNGDIFQSHTHGDLGGHAGDGIAAGLGGKSGRTGNAGVDLDEVILAGIGVKGKLNVAAAFDLKLADDLYCAVVEHLEIMIGKGHDGGDNKGVTCVNADRVDVFHAADGDGVVV